MRNLTERTITNCPRVSYSTSSIKNKKINMTDNEVLREIQRRHEVLIRDYYESSITDSITKYLTQVYPEFILGYGVSRFMRELNDESQDVINELFMLSLNPACKYVGHSTLSIKIIEVDSFSGEFSYDNHDKVLLVNKPRMSKHIEMCKRRNKYGG